jgi:hypothetical protein
MRFGSSWGKPEILLKNVDFNCLILFLMVAIRETGDKKIMHLKCF